MEQLDLTQDGWLQLRRRNNGGVAVVGLVEALVDAHVFTELVVDLPTQMPALLRQLLLPVVADALGLPADREEWGRRFKAGAFNKEERERLRVYLSEHRDRLLLFGDRPFAQVGGLEALSGETKGAGLLVASESTGNNVPFFSSRTEADPPALTPAEAAHWLLHAHCWDTAAIKTGAKGDEKAKAGKTTGNPTGPLGQLGVLVPVGETLYETLLLNLPIGHRSQLGIPQWKRADAGPQWKTGDPDGLLELWTWQSRRIRLVPEETPAGVQVRRVIIAAGDRLRSLPEWEPHTAWKFDKPAAKTKPADRKPRRHVSGKAIWRGLQALLAMEQSDADSGSVETSVLLKQAADLRADDFLPGDYPLRVEAFGIAYGNQSAIIEDLYHDLLPLPVAALSTDTDAYEALVEMTGQAEQLARTINYLSADLRRASGLDPIPWDKGHRPGEQVLHRLDPVVRRVLGNLRDSDDERLDEISLAWEKTAHQVTREVAETIFAAVPETVFAGRKNSGDNGESTRKTGLGNAEYQLRSRLEKVLPRAAEAFREAAQDKKKDTT